MKTINELRVVLDNNNNKSKLVYTWVKSGHINYRQFKELLSEIKNEI